MAQSLRKIYHPFLLYPALLLKILVFYIPNNSYLYSPLLYKKKHSGLKFLAGWPTKKFLFFFYFIVVVGWWIFCNRVAARPPPCCARTFFRWAPTPPGSYCFSSPQKLSSSQHRGKDDNPLSAFSTPSPKQKALIACSFCLRARVRKAGFLFLSRGRVFLKNPLTDLIMFFLFFDIFFFLNFNPAKCGIMAIVNPYYSNNPAFLSPECQRAALANH